MTPAAGSTIPGVPTEANHRPPAVVSAVVPAVVPAAIPAVRSVRSTVDRSVSTTSSPPRRAPSCTASAAVTAPARSATATRTSCGLMDTPSTWPASALNRTSCAGRPARVESRSTGPNSTRPSAASALSERVTAWRDSPTALASAETLILPSVRSLRTTATELTSRMNCVPAATTCSMLCLLAFGCRYASIIIMYCTELISRGV